ncbi:hypothetical protein AA18889_0346 [Acetobacter senegalensis DSM 18889]|nr:hypothetical protein AA18889_0346 [Acetobacter senegalensis DSM 18889]
MHSSGHITTPVGTTCATTHHRAPPRKTAPQASFALRTAVGIGMSLVFYNFWDDERELGLTTQPVKTGQTSM